ncbi:MAG: hypothetical protein EZS28_018046 [Streblomastix strix]|uniref:Uncharacterized protein n=1 Tax=Streblomastix strix TaxID=222440 RepID=A0A5J4VVY1_9EUKA|nr:MAG: hypothetical protein EZS28_018046 [Streblomastix strix]
MLINKFSPISTIQQILLRTDETQIISRFISCAGCGQNNYDDITSHGVDILNSIFITLQKNKLNDEDKKMEDEIKEMIEIEGLEEDNETLIFHTNRREDIDIKQKSVILKQNIYKLIKEQRVDDDDDDDDDEEEETQDDDLTKEEEAEHIQKLIQLFQNMNQK